jgi:hypothetical protein
VGTLVTARVYSEDDVRRHARSEDVMRWRGIITAKLCQMEPEQLTARFGPELLRQGITPKGAAGAAYHLLWLREGPEQAAQFVEQTVAQILSRVSEAREFVGEEF